MINKKKILVTVAITALSAGAVAGCGSSDDGDGPVTLNLMIWDPAQKPGVQKAVDAFMAENKDIKVELEQVPQDQYYTKLDSALSAGEGPDVMWQSSRIPFYVKGGVIEPLDSYIEKDKIDLGNYSEQITKLYNIDGKQYGIPKDQDLWAMVINTKVFNDFGVKIPEGEWTWDDMLATAKEIKAKQTKSTDRPLHYDFGIWNGYPSIFRTLGGEFFNAEMKAGFDSEQGKKALELIENLQKEGLINEISNSADFDPVSSLISGSVSMAYIPSWNFSLLQKADAPANTFKLMPLPSINGKWMMDTNGLSYVMSANSKHKEASWKLIKFLTSDKGAELHAEGGAALPANNSAAVQEAFAKANSNLADLDYILKEGPKHTYLRISTQYPAVRSIAPKINSDILGAYYTGKMSVDDTVKNLDKALNEVVNK
ncbi:hypothetical protein BSR28_01350 [Boudabousia liubingyangii]|uniref:ABC transporter substrate-binding protein n=1 Tax=Boudabousia liubingyangii TaxID=1921764 RepID=UPI00093CC57E|nr:sugar ABC transporter substrate-binding protein [Boudabousia liubingyangii]OKL48376.1 hypothetical protein BSR28_01350 [Boudabousia liubingyangii]